MPSRFCRHTSPNSKGARFTGLIKTRRQVDYAHEVWAFLFGTGKGGKASKMAIIGNISLKTFHYWKQMATIGKF